MYLYITQILKKYLFFVEKENNNLTLFESFLLYAKNTTLKMHSIYTCKL